MSERERKREGCERQCKTQGLNSASSEKAAAPANEPCDASNVNRIESDYK